MSNLHKAPVVVLAVLWCAYFLVKYWGELPGDIEAFYYGSKLWVEGSYDLLYAPSLGPDSTARAEAITRLGARAWADPFFYPPLWAAIFSLISGVTTPIGFSNVLYPLHIALIPISALLTLRCVRSPMSAPIWLAISLALVTFNIIGHQALLQNQIQILVTFLIILAFERESAGHPMVAGSALALAASIKLFPAIFVLAWIFRQRPNRRAVGAFVVVGIALALTSLACGDWDLHVAYLQRLGLQSSTVLVERTNWNLASLTFHLTHLGDLQLVQPGGQGAGMSYSFQPNAPRPIWLSVFVGVLLLAAITTLLNKYKRASELWQRTAFLPAFVGSVALASPLTWAHHYLLVLLFVPALPALYRNRVGWFMVIAFALFTQTTLNLRSNFLPILLQTGMFVGVLAMLLLTLAFMFASGHHRPDQPAQ